MVKDFHRGRNTTRMEAINRLFWAKRRTFNPTLRESNLFDKRYAILKGRIGK